MIPEPYLTIPAEYTRESVETYARLNETSCRKWPVREVYGTLNHMPLPSGRHTAVLPDCKMDFSEYVSCLEAHHIHYNYTFNVNCLAGRDLLSAPRKELVNQLKLLWDAGVRRFTVSMPSIIELINEILPEAEIYLSIIFGLDSSHKLEWMLERRRIVSTYIHERLIRNIGELKKVVDCCLRHDVEPGVLLNSLCDIHCPMRPFHYNLSSHSGETGELPFVWYYGTECNFRRLKDPRKALCIPWIRPDDMQMYTDIGIRRFKFAGRDLIKFGADFAKTAECYNAGHYEGNLMPLLMGFASCERADLYHFDNNEALNQYLTKVFAGELHCHECNDCHDCDSVCRSIFPDADLYRKYMEMYSKRAEMALHLHEQ